MFINDSLAATIVETIQRDYCDEGIWSFEKAVLNYSLCLRFNMILIACFCVQANLRTTISYSKDLLKLETNKVIYTREKQLYFYSIVKITLFK